MSDLDFNPQSFAMEYKLKVMSAFTSEQQQSTFSAWYGATAPALADNATSSREFTAAVQAAYRDWRANTPEAIARAWGLKPRRNKYNLLPKPVPPPVVPEPKPATVYRPFCVKNGSQTCEVCASRPKDGSLAEAQAMFEVYGDFVKKCLWTEIRKYVKEGQYDRFYDLENDTWHAVSFGIAKYKPQVNPETGEVVAPTAWLGQMVHWTVRTHFTREWEKPTDQLNFDGNRGRGDGGWGWDARGKKEGAKPEDTRAVEFNGADIPLIAGYTAPRLKFGS